MYASNNPTTCHPEPSRGISHLALWHGILRRPLRRTPQNDEPRGFTLIELIIAIAILSLMMFGIAELFPRATIAGQSAQRLTGAVSLAQAQMETMLGIDYVSVTNGTFEARHLVTSPFERQTMVEYVDPVTLAVRASDLGLKRVTVTVYYPSPQGERAFDLQTIIASH